MPSVPEPPHSAARASSRKGRELGGIFGFLAMFVAIYAFSLSAQRIEDLDMLWMREQLPLATEVAIGLALGATAVMVARPPMWGLAAYGAEQAMLAIDRWADTISPPDYILYFGCSNDFEDDILFQRGF